MTDPVVLAALRAALEQDPRNGPLWLHLASLLEAAGEHDEALAALRTAASLEDTADDALRRLVPALRRAGQLAEALIRCEDLLERDDDPALRHELATILELRGDAAGAAKQRERAGPLPAPTSPAAPGAAPMPPAAPASPPEAAAKDDASADTASGADASAAGDARADDAAEDDAASDAADDAPSEARATAGTGPGRPQSELAAWAEQFEWGDLRITFDDVAGLEEVKRQIHLRIIAPFQQPDVYQAFGRDAGGGILLYGPPGCGKTYIARATAGELAARFVSVSIHDVVDKYWGESEKLVHALFEDARNHGPTVLFFDEFDALGGSRGHGDSQFWKTLVDQLLQEMDGVGGRNKDVLLFGATNMPWNVDPAFRRPGRFDRVLFVTPPDEPARRAILQRRLAKLPGGSKVDVARVAKETALYTGADLEHLCERAAEGALERSLGAGAVHELTTDEFEDALRKTQSTALEWFATARNYARYSNEGGRYDELVAFLKAVKKW